MAKINREWHEAHRMLNNASEDERIAWHIDHAKNCGCRKIAGKLAELLQRRGIAIPKFEQSKE